MKSKALVPWLLLTALMPAVLYGIESVELQLGARVTWSEQPTDLGSRCFNVRVPGPGLLAIELVTTAPSSAPGIFVLADADAGAVPKTVQRIEAVMLRVSEPGEHPDLPRLPGVARRRRAHGELLQRGARDQGARRG